MNKQTVVHTDNATLISYKKMSYPDTKRLGRILNTYYYVKEVILKRPYTVQFYLYDILKRTKPWRQEKHQWSMVATGGRQKWISEVGKGILWAMETTLYDSTMVDTYHYTTIHNMKNEPHYGLQVIIISHCRFTVHNKCIALMLRCW